MWGTLSCHRRAGEVTGGPTLERGAAAHWQMGVWGLGRTSLNGRWGRDLTKPRVSSLPWELGGPHGQWTELATTPFVITII